MIKRVLVPLDGSSTAAAILPQLRGLLKRTDVDLMLVRVVNIPPFSYADESFQDLSIYQVLESLVAEARQHLVEQVATLESQGLTARGVVEVGEPARTILSVGAREQADLIAITTHGRTGLARWALGSVTEKILRASGIPMLVFRSFGEGGEPTAESELSLSRLLVPTDGSANSLAVAPVAVALARLFDAEVRPLHVVVPPAGEFFHTQPEERLATAVQAFADLGVEAEGLIRKGDPAGEILDACAELQAGMIAMSSHGRTGLGRWLMGSVTERVLRAATVPMLLVRGSRH